MELVWLARICSGLVRIGSCLVFIFLLADVLPLYDNIRNSPGINEPPYSAKIKVSLLAAAIAVRFFSFLLDR
jgi:hypothetical protein